MNSVACNNYVPEPSTVSGRRGRRYRVVPEELRIILSATINGLAARVNIGFADPERLEELTDAAVRQFLRGAAP